MPKDTELELTLISQDAFFGKEVRISEFPSTIGRHTPDFEDPGPLEAKLAVGKMSRDHARFTFEGGTFRFEDLGSTNGSFHNARMLAPNEPVVLASGDSIGITPWLNFSVQLPALPEPIDDGPEAKKEAEPETSKGPSQPEAGSQRQPETEPVPAPEAKKEPEPEPVPEAKKEPEPVPAPEAKKEPEPVPAPEAKKEPEPEPVPEAKKEPEPVPEAKKEASPEPKVEPPAKPGTSDSQPKEPDQKTDVEDDSMAKAQASAVLSGSGFAESEEFDQDATVMSGSSPLAGSAIPGVTSSGIEVVSDEEWTEAKAGGTIMLGESNRATSAFDVLAQAHESKASTPATKPSGTKPRKKRTTWFTVWWEMRLTRALFIGAILVGIAAFAIWKVVTGPATRTREMIDAGQYQEAVNLVRETIGPTSEPNSKLERLLLLAVVREMSINRNWPSVLMRGEYDRSRELADGCKAMAPESAQVTHLSEFMKLAADIIQKGEELQTTRVLQVYRDEKAFGTLLERWQRNQSTYQRMAIMVQEASEEKTEILAQVNAHRARFRNYENTLIKSLNTLKTLTARRLAANHPDELEELYRKFRATYGAETQPVRIDIGPLERDLVKYLAAWRAVRDQRVDRLVDLDPDSFACESFRKSATQLLATGPGKDVLAKYALSRSAWAKGEIATCLRLLREVKDTTWGEVAAGKLAEYTVKNKAIETLSSITAVDDLASKRRVLEAYRLLGAPGDAYYRKLHKPLFDKAKGSIHAEAKTAMDAAGVSWKQYIKRGKIGLKHRQTNMITDEYKLLAAHLKQSVEQARKWHLAISLVGVPQATAERRLHDEIIKEGKFQWKRMQEATLIVSAEVVAKKLKHLPKPDRLD